MAHQRLLLPGERATDAAADQHSDPVAPVERPRCRCGEEAGVGQRVGARGEAELGEAVQAAGLHPAEAPPLGVEVGHPAEHGRFDRLGQAVPERVDADAARCDHAHPGDHHAAAVP